MNALTRFGALILGGLALAACQERKQEVSPAASATAPAAAASAAPIPDEQVATAADFEEKAVEEITEENAEQQLAKLEQEISTE